MTAQAAGPAASTAAQLREAFDSSFAQAPPVAREQPEELLAIGVAGKPYALRLAEVAGLHLDRPVAPIPGAPPALAGIASLRGSVVAAYDLRLLLGEPADGPCRWLVLAAADATVGLAFDEFEGQLRVSRDEIAADGGTGPSAAWEAVTVAQVTRPILAIPQLLEAINEPHEVVRKEQSR